MSGELINIPEALRRLVRSRLKDPWFKTELRDILATGEAREILLATLSPRIDHAINAAIRGHLARSKFRELVKSIVAEVLAERDGRA